MRASIVILVWASATVPALATQPQAPDVIPRELAVALLDRFEVSPTPMEIVVGRLPKSFPIDALPREGITILGGVEREWGAAVVAAVPQRTDSAAARVTARLARAGWRRADEDRHLGGFVPKMTARPIVFCRANAVLTFSARERRNAGGSLLHLGVSYPDDAYSACATRAQRRSMYERDFPTLPTLESPPDARMLGGGSGGGSRESREAYTRLATEQGAIEVGTHYAAQLQRAGWTVTAPIRANGMVVYRAQSLDAQKRPLTGALIVLEIPETRQLDVAFRVARATRER